MSVTHLSQLLFKTRLKIITEAKTSKYIDSWFLQDHLLVVEELTNWLCNLYPQADREVVILAVWFHDLGRLRGKNDDHHQYGADEAKKTLAAANFPTPKTKLVCEACRNHRCHQGEEPQSIEAKILATSDAMSHFYRGFYFRLFQLKQKELIFERIIEFIEEKLNRDFRDKIMFPEAKEKIRPLFEAWQEILNMSKMNKIV